MTRRVLQALACVIALGTSLFGATYSGTLAAPAVPGSAPSVATWNGGSLSGALTQPLEPGNIAPQCRSAICDFYNLTVEVPQAFYASHANYAVHVRLNWASRENDLDVYVYDSAGNLIGGSTQARSNMEDADLGALPAGSYQVQIVPSGATRVSYTGTVVLAPEPPRSRFAQYTQGNFTFTSQPLTRPSQAQDSGAFYQQAGEPRVVHDAAGNIYVAGIQASPAGTELWKSSDGGMSFSYLGQPGKAEGSAIGGAKGAGFGGGDQDLQLGASGNLYVSSLWSSGIMNCRSRDTAVWKCNRTPAQLRVDDRPWLAAYGANILYLSAKGERRGGGETIYVAKSFDGGRTFPQVVEITKRRLGIEPGDAGNLVVDPNSGNVYTAFFGEGANKIYLAKSTDGGLSWTLKLIHATDENASLQHVFPATAVDRGGNLHVVFSDGSASYLTSSADQGATWTTPVRVNTGANAKTAVEPWVVAGDAGKVNVFFYGTPDPDHMSSSAQWQVFMAQTQDAFAPAPVFALAAATSAMHNGAICADGTTCPTGTRSLLEYFFPDVYSDGNALAAYPDDLHSDPATTITELWFLRQVSGTRISGN